MATDATKSIAECARLKITVRGVVQGVGFRPFVHRLATELSLAGRICNSVQGVAIEVEGPRAALECFSRRLGRENPPRSRIQEYESAWLDAVGFDDFHIDPSETGGERSILVSPDIATCPDCLQEIFDPANRRHGYPFTNCTNCGPRFSIIMDLPYDRVNTTMAEFKMCPVCQAEYNDPANRRFHAQPNACPRCGPQLAFWNLDGNVVGGGNDALLDAAAALRAGRILAVKGIGGFHLMADARNAASLARLRERKHRPEKAFALMFPSLVGVKAVCRVSALEEQILQSAEAPIVLLEKLPEGVSPLAHNLAPGNPNLGILLPYSPLHYLLLAELGFPVVATSGNLGDEPICTDEYEALERLRGIADFFLVHNRPIVRHEDDSLVRVTLGRAMILRRARGYAPLPVRMPVAGEQPGNILAVGGHLKNTVALSVGEQVFLSQHIGDLEAEPAHAAFCRAAADLPRLYEVKPGIIAADLHPDYLSTKYADALARKPEGTRPARFHVQHHVAHVLSCIADGEVDLPVFGVAWDGTGFGPDGTIWGGEFFLVSEDQVRRVAHLRPFRLPGGEAAVVQPRRAALGLLYEMFGPGIFEHRELTTSWAFTPVEMQLLQTMLLRGVNAPFTSSIGRLFDAIASLTGLCQKASFEGQAAMQLEFSIKRNETNESYSCLSELPLDGQEQSSRVLDWRPMLEELLLDCHHRAGAGKVSAKFHHALVETMIGVARKAGCPRVVLSGGCFQNAYLTERAVKRLREEDFCPHWHERVPPNDGGIALGQVYAARRGWELKE
jgi:hydrogenase maturation protein HypF